MSFTNNSFTKDGQYVLGKTANFYFFQLYVAVIFKNYFSTYILFVFSTIFLKI